MTQPAREQLIRIGRNSSPLSAQPTEVKPRLKPISGIRLLAFDIYGTLVISASGDIGTIAPDAGAVRFRTLVTNELGIELPPGFDPELLFHQQVKNIHAGLKAEGIPYPEVDSREIWQKIARDAGIGADAEVLALLFELARNPVWPMPGSIELLKALKGVVPLGIVSNAQFYTPLLISHFFPDGLETFDSRLVTWSYTLRRAKPDPLLFQPLIDAAWQGYRIEPQEILYVGNDMLNDISTASGEGLKTVLFAGDKRSLRLREGDRRVSGVEPDLIITNFNQLTDLVPQIQGDRREKVRS